MKPRSPDGRRHSIALMLISLLLASVLWANVQVSRAGANSVSNRRLEVRGLGEDLVHMPKEPDLPTINVDFKGSEEDVRDIPGREFQPFVNLSGLEPGKHTVRVQLDRGNLPRNLEHTLRPGTIDITVEPMVRQPRKVVVQQTGVPPAGFLVARVDADPSTVEVSGARADVARVAAARVRYDLAQAEETGVEAAVELVDERGEPVLDVRSDRSTVRVTAALVPAPATRALPVQPTWSGELPVGYRVQRYELDPPQIRVSAESSLLANLVALETEAISLTGRRSTFTTRARVKFPKGVVAVGADSVSVRVYIGQAPQPKVETPPSNPPAQKPPP